MALTPRLAGGSVVFAAVVLVAAATAPAQEAIPLPEASTSIVDQVRPEPGLDRPFLFVVDPSLPAPGHVIASAGLGNVARTGEVRPIGAGQLIPTAGFEVGALSRLSVYGEAEFAFDSAGSAPPANAGFEVGTHVLLTDPRSRNFRAAMQASFGRDLSAMSKVLVNATAAWDIERLRVAASLTGFHDFGTGTDPIDLNGAVAASYLLPASFRLGAELAAQDLEEIGAAKAEGGTSAFVGPSLGYELAQRFQVVAGPAFGITSAAPRVLVRAVASILF
jgi:hypothetical protein